MRLKLAENFKPFFQETTSPLAASMSFQTPLTNPLSVSAEARTQGQPICFQPTNKQGPAFPTRDNQPKACSSLYWLLEQALAPLLILR